MDEAILSKLKKLMALEEGAKIIGSMEEAANAASKVQTLLIKHNLSMAAVNGFEETTVESGVISAEDLSFNKREGKWLLTLATQLAEPYLCRGIGSTARGQLYKITFVGETQNLDIIQFTYNQLVIMARSLCRKDFKTYWGDEKFGTFRRGYLSGFAIGVGAKLRDTMEKAKESSDVTALVLVKSEAVDKHTEKIFPYLSSSKASRTSSQDGRVSGYKAGYNANVNKGIGSSFPKGSLN